MHKVIKLNPNAFNQSPDSQLRGFSTQSQIDGKSEQKPTLEAAKVLREISF
jgi:hypothetical protein